MIRNGSEGSLNLYFKGLLISSYPLTKKKTFERYFYQGEYLIRKSKHIPIKLQIKTYLKYCNMILNRKKNKQPIYASDHIMFMNSLFALMRLRIIDDDESNGYLIMKKKK
tara:strand:+ start:12715 stop:13044 length:330 start_codon:yes stop_codon:yes gene_type:complete